MDVTAPSVTQMTKTSATTEPAKKTSSDYETFLKMLTTQIQNQDPLNPIDSADYAVQLATFSGVEQQVKTNDLLAALGGQLGASGISQAAGWVGMEARSAAPAAFRGEPVAVETPHDATADSAVLVVRNAFGAEIDRQAVSLAEGTHDWTGRLADGSQAANGLYSFSVESYREGALLTTTPAETYARIAEVRLEGGQTMLKLADGSKIAASSVTGLRS